MSYSIRPATPADHADISAFTTSTFEWGDYVADAFPAWLEDPSLHVLVAEASDGTVVGLMKSAMPAPRQVWLAAARVHPDHRGQGLASRLNQGGVDWGAAEGAKVARLLIEDWNEAPQRQVEKMGYRRTAGWTFATAGTVPAKRLPVDERLRPASRQAADDAFIAWNSGDLVRITHGLGTRHWVCWTWTAADVVDAKVRHALWECPSGWVIAEMHEGRLEASWLQASPADSPRIIDAICDLAVELQADSIAVWVPSDESLLDALGSREFDVSRSSVWERPL